MGFEKVKNNLKKIARRYRVKNINDRNRKRKSLLI